MTDEEKAAAELAAANSNDATEINDDDLLAAVSAAVDEQTTTPEKDDDNADDDTGEEDDAGEDDEGEDDGAEGNEEDDAEGKPKDEEDDESDEDSEDDGGDGSADSDDKDGDTEKPGDDDAADADHVNDPIPEATNEKTATRIRSLIELVKGKDASEAQRDEIVERITDTGADPEQYANTLGFLKLYNSADVKDRKTALEVMRGMVKELALDVGEGASVTKLEDHDDLQAEVEAGTLTEKRAIEIAATRERQTMTDNRTAADNAKTETATQTQQNIATGKGQLDTLEASLRTNEANYAALRPMFIGVLKSVLKRTHPTEWGVAAQEVFEQVKLANPNVAATPKPKPKNTPLRPKQGAGGGNDKKTEGGDALDAVNEALDNM